jgi:hypothetical protein
MFFVTFANRRSMINFTSIFDCQQSRKKPERFINSIKFSRSLA